MRCASRCATTTATDAVIVCNLTSRKTVAAAAPTLRASHLVRGHNLERFDAVVVGRGQGGLATSHALADRGVAHVVLERGRIAETWRTQRWRSFRLTTPRWA